MRNSYSSHGVPIGMKTILHKLLGMVMAQIRMRTLIIYVFPFSHIILPKYVLYLSDLYFYMVFYPFQSKNETF